MSGSSTSFNSATLVGCRVAGAPTYVPAYMPAGAAKPVRQMATFGVYQNINGKPSRFRVTAWGKLADVVAKSCAPGKELTLFCELNSYAGKVPMPNLAPGTPLQFITGADGQPIQTEKVGLTLRRIHFGQDSNKQIQAEIQAGQRQPMWNVEGSPDNVAWKQTCQQRNALQFVQGSGNFGYATVRQPNGQIVDPATINNANLNTQGTAQYAQAPAAGGAPGFQGADPNAGAQVNVHGQNMGYQMPAQQPAPAAQPTQPVNTGFSM